MSLFKDVDLTKKPKQEFTPIADGTYKAVLSNTEGDIAVGSEYLQLEYTVSEGDFKNRKVWKRYFLNPQGQWYAQNLENVGKDLIKYGVSVNDINSVQELIESMFGKRGTTVEIYVKNNQKGDKVYTNVYLNDLLISHSEAPSIDKDEDIPF